MTSHVFSTLCSGWNSFCAASMIPSTAGKEEHHGYDHAVEVLGTCLSERMPFANFRFCLPIAHQQEYLIAAVHDAVDRFVQHGGRPGDRKSHELRYGYQYVGSQGGNDTHHAALVFLLLFLHILSVYFPASLLISFSISIFSS